ncbi:hypothetical protein Lalb_Chr00c01g0403741 [Lupinus albus]|uniref:Uncharacterized protein n=1 Tax=Lupinus albus TaxID=3870 RepID=A0A6A4N243_LUPAL|nr:hypothetical protein Lalb_Chr00c01g0403741 [Lupinus albus]
MYALFSNPVCLHIPELAYCNDAYCDDSVHIFLNFCFLLLICLG